MRSSVRRSCCSRSCLSAGPRTPSADAGGPLAVLVIAIVAAEVGKMVSKETPIDVLVTPLVTIFVGVALAALIAPPIGAGADYSARSSSARRCSSPSGWA